MQRTHANLGHHAVSFMGSRADPFRAKVAEKAFYSGKEEKPRRAQIPSLSGSFPFWERPAASLPESQNGKLLITNTLTAKCSTWNILLAALADPGEQECSPYTVRLHGPSCLVGFQVGVGDP